MTLGSVYAQSLTECSSPTIYWKHKVQDKRLLKVRSYSLHLYFFQHSLY